MVTALARVADIEQSIFNCPSQLLLTRETNSIHASQAIHNPYSQKPIPPDVELLFSDGY